MRYFAKFDVSGIREASIAEYVNFEVIAAHDVMSKDEVPVVIKHIDESFEPSIPDGFIEITEQDQQLYVTNEYIRGTDGKPQKKPKKFLTKEEKIDALNTEYDSQFSALATSLGLATLSGDQTIIDSIKSDYTELKAEYQIKLEAINNG